MTIRIGRKGTSPVGAIMAILGGGAVAATVMLAPIGPVELAAEALRLPAILPAAAPPLGEKARLLFAFASGLSTMTLVVGIRSVIGRLKKGSSFIRIGYEIGYEDEGERHFGSSHAGQPRRPLFASSDLDGIAPLVSKPAPAPPTEGIRMPLAPAPLDDSELELEQAMVASPKSVPIAIKQNATLQPVAIVEDPSGVLMAARIQPSDYSALSITELVARFERGLSHRKQLIAEAVASKQALEEIAVEHTSWPEAAKDAPQPQAAPEPKSIDAEVDEALRAALGTLHRMTARAA